MSDPQIDVEISTGIDEISVSYDTAPNVINIDESTGFNQIQVIEVSTSFSAVDSVNSLSGNVRLTHLETLSYISPVNGVYRYTINHNLGYDYPIVMVYNTDNESVVVEHNAIDANTVEVISLSSMNNFKVVVQR